MTTTDDFFRQDAERLGMTLDEYEQAFGIRFHNGPSERRQRYHERPAGLLTDEDLAEAQEREARYTPDRNRKRRRGFHPDGASIGPTGGQS